MMGILIGAFVKIVVAFCDVRFGEKPCIQSVRPQCIEILAAGRIPLDNSSVFGDGAEFLDAVSGVLIDCARGACFGEIFRGCPCDTYTLELR
jgi:hypothetical protein